MDSDRGAGLVDSVDLGMTKSFRIAAGLNHLTLSVPCADWTGGSNDLSIRFRFDWLKVACGSRARIELIYRTQHMAAYRLNSYGPTFFRFDIRDVEPSYDLKLRLFVEELADTTEIGDGRATMQLGEASIVSASVQPVYGTGCNEIVRYAVSAAKALGLAEVYMVDEKLKFFETRVRDSLIDHVPLSIVRLGDGEGRLLGYPLYFDQNRILTEVLYYQFGPESIQNDTDDGGWIDDLISELTALLRLGIETADMIGLPVVEYFENHEHAVTPGMVGYAYATHVALGRWPRMDRDEAIGTNVFQQLAELPEFFPRIAKAATSVTTVGPWDLSDALRAALGVAQVSHIGVPAHYTWGPDKGLGQFPVLYKKVRSAILGQGDLRGHLFLVGAGLLGKYYCALIKQQGGVALDVGSVFDSWGRKGLPYAVENGARIHLSLLDPTAGRDA